MTQDSAPLRHSMHPNDRILYLEDDDEIREPMSDFLIGEGYDVTAVGNAEDALDQLKTGPRHRLLLTDYRLPNENADWLLREAKAASLLERTAVIVLSAEINPPGIAGYKLLRKPVSIDVLLTAISEALPPAASLRVSTANDLRASTPGITLLRLYVAAASPESRRAVQNLQRILRKFDAAAFQLEVFDVSSGDERILAAADEDRIVVTPTLVRRGPLPRVWIMGDLSRREVVEDMMLTSVEQDQ